MNTAIKEPSIDTIISQMDEIIQRCIDKKSRLGYFAVLYRNVTGEVRNKIKSGYFDDNARMEKLVIVFAGRYLEAITQFWNNLISKWFPGFEHVFDTVDGFGSTA